MYPTKSSALKSKQHNNQNVNNNEIYVLTCLVLKPLGAKQSSQYRQKLSRILLPPVSLSIIFTLISFRNPRWPSSVKCLKNSTWGSRIPWLHIMLKSTCKAKYGDKIIWLWNKHWFWPLYKSWSYSINQQPLASFVKNWNQALIWNLVCPKIWKIEKMGLWLLRSSHLNGVHVFGTFSRGVKDIHKICLDLAQREHSFRSQGF